MILTFPEILIATFAFFLICLLVDRGGDFIADKINKGYRYKF